MRSIKRESLTKGDLEAFHIGTDIPDNVSDAISQQIVEKGKIKKCKNFVPYSHALYAFVVFSMFLKEQKTKEQSEQAKIDKILKTFLQYFQEEIDYIEKNNTALKVYETNDTFEITEAAETLKETEKAHKETNEK